MGKKKSALNTPLASTGDVVVLRVALAGDEDVWRKIAILPEQNLDDLHEAIFEAFERYDDHLYSFTFLGRRTPRSRPVPVSEYLHPLAFEPGWLPEDGPPAEFDAAETTIGSLNLQPKQTFEYLFDFGDSWEHLITVEAIDAPRAKRKSDYPVLLESHGEAPPQYQDEEDYEDEEDDDESSE